MDKLLNNKYHQKSIRLDNVSIIPDIRYFTLYCFFYANSVLFPSLFHDRKLDYIQTELLSDINEIITQTDTLKILAWNDYLNQKPYHFWQYVYYTSFISLESFFEEDFSDEVHEISANSLLSELGGFNRVLFEFFHICQIENLFFRKYQKVLLANMEIYNEKNIYKEKEALFDYLKIDSSHFGSHKLVIIPIPFDEEGCGYGAPHKEIIYMFESNGAQTGGINTHEYLHFFINPIVESVTHLDTLPIARIFERNLNKNWVKHDYSELYTYISECFVRAIDYRIHLKIDSTRQYNFEKLSENGLELVKTIFVDLISYEQNNDYTINQYIYDYIINYAES